MKFSHYEMATTSVNELGVRPTLEVPPNFTAGRWVPFSVDNGRMYWRRRLRERPPPKGRPPCRYSPVELFWMCDVAWRDQVQAEHDSDLAVIANQILHVLKSLTIQEGDQWMKGGFSGHLRSRSWRNDDSHATMMLRMPELYPHLHSLERELGVSLSPDSGVLQIMYTLLSCLNVRIPTVLGSDRSPVYRASPESVLAAAEAVDRWRQTVEPTP